MKKHILFSSGSLKMGGVERVLVEYLNVIDKNKYKITLFILSDFGVLDVFRKDIPEYIEIRFLKPEKLVTRTAYLKHNKKNVFNKMLYNIYMSVERYVLKKNFVKNLKEIQKVDVLIDFDSGLTKLDKETKGLKKIAWTHNSLPNLLKKEKKISNLIEFHTSYKYLIYSKSQNSYKILGKIVANSEKKDIEELYKDYEAEFLKAIATKSTLNKTYNILLHIFGYFKKHITKEEKVDILESMYDFKNRVIPLISVIKIFNIYINRFDITYLKNQHFLNPYPSKLALRSDLKSFKWKKSI